MDGKIEQVDIGFDELGSLATTHRSQGSDMGLFGGFLGWTADDERLPGYEAAIDRHGIQIHINIGPYGDEHPNTYRLRLGGGESSHEVIAISVGGGMIEVQEIDGCEVSMAGDFFEILAYGESLSEARLFAESAFPEAELFDRVGDRSYLHIRMTSAPSEALLSELGQHPQVQKAVLLRPVLPILSRRDVTVPFRTAKEMLDYNDKHELELWQLALRYESIRGNISEEEVYEKMNGLVDVMQHSIETGLAGTTYRDRILPDQSKSFAKSMTDGRLLAGDTLNTIVLYVSAIMEVKSSMGVIVAAPTAGACAALPGAVVGAVKSMDADRDQAIKAMLAAGLIGVFIAEQASFAAEVGGCQAECGSGSCMAAGALVQLMGGTVEQALSAASQALQNSLGMICDPIANRVEAPCLGKNVMAASNALSCANMGLANYNHLIPLDQVIQTMARVSEQMARELRCTALGGLAITQAAKDIEAALGNESLSTAAGRFKIC